MTQLGPAHRAEVLDGLRRAFAQRQQDFVGHDPLARDIARLRPLLAPRGELTGNSELTARAGVHALHALERGAGIAAIMGGVGKGANLVAHPGRATERMQLGLDDASA